MKLKASKDVNAFKVVQKTLANDQKVESQAILDLSANLKAISPEIAEKVHNQLVKQIFHTILLILTFVHHL